MVWVGISINDRTNLYNIRNGSLIAQQYKNEILTPLVVPYARLIEDNFILMENNCNGK